MSEVVIDYRKKETKAFDVYADEEIPDATAALVQNDATIASIGDVSTVTGMPKSRKTFLLAAMAVAFLKDDGYLSISSELTEKRLLIIDTEQSRKFVIVLLRRIYRLMGWDFKDRKDDMVRVLTLRELTPEQRWEVVQKTIEEYRPQLVFIDGSADLVNDTNDQAQSMAMVQELMRLSSEKKCHICSVVHTNPNSEKTRGHFGSELQRKSETVMFVQRDGDVTTIKPQFCRNLEFAPFSFIVNERGLPEQCDVVVPKIENLSEIFREIYSYSEALSWGDLRDNLMSRLDKGKTACENRIKTGLVDKIIYKDINGLYRLFIEPKEKDLPFETIKDELPF